MFINFLFSEPAKSLLCNHQLNGLCSVLRFIYLTFIAMLSIVIFSLFSTYELELLLINPPDLAASECQPKQ